MPENQAQLQTPLQLQATFIFHYNTSSYGTNFVQLGPEGQLSLKSCLKTRTEAKYDKTFRTEVLKAQHG